MGDPAALVLEATGIKKAYDGRVVLDIDSLAVRRGEVLVILGPSGAGKSVFLRILNLLEEPSSGVVHFEGMEVQGLEGPKRIEISRRMALIFQDPLLFRGTVVENVTFGLKVRRVPAPERASRVAAALEVVRLTGLEDKHVSTLSGGEAQRVALARALVIEPDVLLLDEPFASLDAPTRRSLQGEVGEILKGLGMTAVFVTHDQEEAARLGDRIVVMEDGRIAQEGSPREIFYEPDSEFVAGFIGFENIYEGRVAEVHDGLITVDVDGSKLEVVADGDPGQVMKLGIRPEDVTLFPASAGVPCDSSRNAFIGDVTDVELRGPVARVTVECPFSLVALITRRSLEELGIAQGGQVGARFKATAVVVIEP